MEEENSVMYALARACLLNCMTAGSALVTSAFLKKGLQKDRKAYR